MATRHPSHREPAGPRRGRGVSGLEISLAAMSGAIRDLHGEVDRLVAGLERREAEWDSTRPPAAAPGPISDTRNPSSGEPATPVTPPASSASPHADGRAARRVDDSAEALAPRLIAALALVGSVVLLDVSFALAVAVVLVTTVVLRVRWWMAAVAALSLTAIIVVDRTVAEGAYANEFGALTVVFLMLALALLLSESWERIRPADPPADGTDSHHAGPGPT